MKTLSTLSDGGDTPRMTDREAEEFWNSLPKAKLPVAPPWQKERTMSSVEQLADAILFLIPKKSGPEEILPHALAANKERIRKTLLDALYNFKQDVVDEIESTYKLEVPNSTVPE